MVKPRALRNTWSFQLEPFLGLLFAAELLDDTLRTQSSRRRTRFHQLETQVADPSLFAKISGTKRFASS